MLDAGVGRGFSCLDPYCGWKSRLFEGLSTKDGLVAVLQKAVSKARVQHSCHVCVQQRGLAGFRALEFTSGGLGYVPEEAVGPDKPDGDKQHSASGSGTPGLARP